jgi:hypothetical protein
MRSLALVLMVAACASGGDGDDFAETDVSHVEGKFDGGEVTVRAGETTLTVNKTIAVREGLFVLRGKTSRTLTDGRGYIFDDIYGDWAQKSARVFEITWPVSTARGLADGVDQFIGMDFVHSSSRPDHLTARAIVRPRLGEFSGSTKIYLVSELTPVIVAGEVKYRITGRTYGANSAIRLVANNASAGWVTRDGTERFSIDLDPQFALRMIENNVELKVVADLPTGSVEKHVKLGLALKKLGMTAGDVEAAWPVVSCAAVTKSCLTALPNTTLDLASCGEAIKVNACSNDVGVRVDDVAFSAKLTAAGHRLATPAARSDAEALVGTARADQFLGGAEQQINHELEGMFGRWFLGTQARDSQLDLAVERGFDTAYAFPLDYVDETAVDPTNAAAMRQFVADAVLRELARKEFLTSALARSLETLVREFRAQHIASIKAFRTTVVAAPYMTTKSAFVGEWLGLYTEVVVDRTTGDIEYTLVEID